MTITDRVFTHHGFALNYASGKTEAVVAAHGKGAASLKCTLAHDMQDAIPFHTDRNIQMVLKCVPAYKHLGSMRGTTVAMAAEIKSKCSTIAGAVAQLRPKVLSNDLITLRAKAHLFQATLLSRVLFNAGAWPLLTSAEYTRIHTAILRHIRAIANSETRRHAHDDSATTQPTAQHPSAPHQDQPTRESTNDRGWLSDQQVYQITGMCAPFVSMLRLRVLLLVRVLLSGPLPLRLVLSAAAPARRSWLRAIQADTAWLAKHTDEFKHWAGKHFADICVDICANPGRVRAKINGVMSNVAYSDKSLWATTATQRAIDVLFPCLHCDQVFATKQGLAVHTYSAHGFVRSVRSKVNTHYCAACLQHFSTIERVICHLCDKSTRCMATYLMCIPDLPQDEYTRAREEAAAEARSCIAAGHKRHYAAAPAVRMSGPLSWHATRAGICHTQFLRDGRRRRTVGEVMDAIADAAVGAP